MPRLVVVSIPGYNNSWWWGFGIPRDRTFESLPITSGVLLALGETGSMLRTVMMSVFGSRVPTISYLQPGPLFRQGLRIQLVDLVRSLQYESSATLFHAIARAVCVRFHFGFHRDHFLVRLTERMNVERALGVRNFTSEFLLIAAASRRIARHHASQGRGSQDRSGSTCSHLSLACENICELDLSSNQGNTTNLMFILMFIPSWSWLQITVQTTTYSPGSLGAATVNSWVPGFRRKSQSGTGFRSFARSREKPCIEPSRFRFLAFLAVIRRLICSPVFTVMTGCFWSLIL